MAEQTLTYSMGANGWTSFHSYFPEWMIGVNNMFYSFKNGDIYEHHSNASRNQYYGVNYPSTVTVVFNDQPIDAKMFKTIELEGTDACLWIVTGKHHNIGF
jgi:restriction endonuclease S subunit